MKCYAYLKDSDFSEKQVDLIRLELASIYEESHYKNLSFSYLKLGKLVEDYFDKLNPQQKEEIALYEGSNFELSLSHGEVLYRFIKSTNSRRMDPEDKLRACAVWLIEGEFSKMTSAELLGHAAIPKLCHSLHEFLYEDTDAKPALTATNILGTYHLQCGPEHKQREARLELEKTKAPEVTMVKATLEIKSPIDTKNGYLYIHENHKGWGVISPDDQLHLLMKNEKEKCNTILISVGTDDGILTLDNLEKHKESGFVNRIIFIFQKRASWFDEDFFENNSTTLTSIIGARKNVEVLNFMRSDVENK